MKQMLIHKEADYTVLALLEDGQVMQTDIDRPGGKQSAGNIYKGRVVNVLPGMQAAFVDIGQGKNAFLFIDELLEPNRADRGGPKPSITELVRAGQQLIVQITKEPIDGKGARVTTNIALPGRCMVYMPEADYVGVSRKISPEEARERLRTAGERLRRPGEGLIIRTIAHEAALDELQQEVASLRETWTTIRQAAGHAEAPAELYGGNTLPQRVVAELMSRQADEVWIDDAETYASVAAMLRLRPDGGTSPLRRYEEPDDMLVRFGVLEQLDRAYARRVRLPSGGELVWDQTEALTVIDVNTGKFVGTHMLEDTVYHTNLEAAVAIARLLRLRDTGGIILIDFIDMELEQHRSAVKQRLEQELANDKTQSHILGWTRLGLLEMTRQKKRENALGALLETCATCRGRGKLYNGPGLRERAGSPRK